YRTDDIPGRISFVLHRRISEALEVIRAGDVTALAHHWRAAGDRAKEAEYAQRAGQLALTNSAYLEAAGYFDRALEVHRERAATAQVSSRTRRRFLNPLSAIDPDGEPFRLATLEGGLSEAHYRL